MFERCLFFNINALTRVINRIWDEAFAEFDLSPSHAYLLRLVLTTPGLSPKQIGDELHLEKSTITRFLDVLEKKGMVQRKVSTEDARSMVIYPSRKAQAIEKALHRKGEQLYRKMQKTIGENELSALVGHLREIKQGLE